MFVPKSTTIKTSLEALVKELKSVDPNYDWITEEWGNGYRSGQWDAGFHLEELLKEFFDY
jgi:hypothetical protein